MKKIPPKFLAGLLIITFIFLFFSLLNINAPFNHLTSDSDAFFGLAAKNMAEQGIVKMKFGLYPGIIQSGDVLEGNFYAHHPAGFVLPTAIIYKLFGQSEATTRLGPLLLTLLALWLFAFALRKIFQNDKRALLATFILSILPGFIFYGETLEIAVAGLQTGLISFSVFVLAVHSTERPKLLWFYFSLFIGGIFSWFFYFSPAAIWLYLWFTKISRKKQLLFFIPLILIFVFSLNLAHFYWLNGGFFPDLKMAAGDRMSSLPAGHWFSKIFLLLKLNLSIPFAILSIGGLFIFFARFKKEVRWRIFLPLLLYPILICLVFRQWVTHPFGVIYFLPIAAIFSSLVLISLHKFIICKFGSQRKKISLAIIAFVLLIGVYSSWRNLDDFFKKHIILNRHDIEALQFLGQLPDLHDKELCVGINNFHVSINRTVEWYVKKKISCTDGGKIKMALVYNPELDKTFGGDFYQANLQKFLDLGLIKKGCSGSLCLLVRNPSSSK